MLSERDVEILVRTVLGIVRSVGTHPGWEPTPLEAQALLAESTACARTERIVNVFAAAAYERLHGEGCDAEPK